MEGRNRELIFAEDGQTYAFVCDAKGEGRYHVLCSDGAERRGILRGKLWKRCWVRRHDMVLACLRDFQDGKCDIVHKYNGEEVLRLASLGELPADLMRHYNSGEYEPSRAGDGEDLIVFEQDPGVDAI